jgi:deoxycytidine triphosphate deaminase
MSVLSNVDIQNELTNTKDIRIFPLDLSNIKSSTYNLTASEYAWSLGLEKSIFNHDLGVIQIPPHDTGLIATKEVIWVSERICGTYHSKVTIATEGGGHIGTTLDSTWLGHSIIAVHNHTKNTIEIGVDKTFVSIKFHYLNSPTTKKQENRSSQTDKIPFSLSKSEKEYFDITWKNDSDELLEKVKGDDGFIKLTEKVKMEEEQEQLVTENKMARKKIIGVSVFTALFIIGTLWWQTKVETGSFLYNLLNFVLVVCFSGLFIPIYTKIFKR